MVFVILAVPVCFVALTDIAIFLNQNFDLPEKFLAMGCGSHPKLPAATSRACFTLPII